MSVYRGFRVEVYLNFLKFFVVMPMYIEFKLFLAKSGLFYSIPINMVIWSQMRFFAVLQTFLY